MPDLTELKRLAKSVLYVAPELKDIHPDCIAFAEATTPGNILKLIKYIEVLSE